MPNQTNSSTEAPTAPRSKSFVAVLRILSRSVLAIFLLSLFAALLPLQLQSPLWYLKAGQAAVDYSVTLLFALFLFFIVEYLRSRDEDLVRPKSSALRITTIAMLVYGILVPVMIFGYGLYWLQTGEQVKLTFSQAQRQVATLEKRIRSAQSDRELLEILFPQGAPASRAQSPSLMPQKETLIREVAGRFTQLRRSLADRRQAQLSRLALGTAKGVIGSMIIVASLAAIRSAVVPP
jgi:hypothetical protein